MLICHQMPDYEYIVTSENKFSPYQFIYVWDYKQLEAEMKLYHIWLSRVVHNGHCKI